jgi:mannitol-specific phosphotransferase system IIBC component
MAQVNSLAGALLFEYPSSMKARIRPTSVSADGMTAGLKHLRDAVGNAALEGIKPRPQALADLKAVVDGTLTADQYRQRVKARYGVQG